MVPFCSVADVNEACVTIGTLNQAGDCAKGTAMVMGYIVKAIHKVINTIKECNGKAKSTNKLGRPVNKAMAKNVGKSV